ncbi:MAG: Gfo/Idh/MocA family oxidoreductase [Bacteroidales bacterium]|nr:MAG: Gfo/Idh/MocA family oxidoreductase [Bacteroidales bacterium]
MTDKSKKKFAIIGVGGYIAAKHLRAIKETGNELVASLDPSDSVGLIDQYFPDSDFFVEFERFDRHIDRLRRTGTNVDYVSICSPNYLHDSHIRFALRSGAHAICEKPLVLNPWNVEGLEEIQNEFGKHIYNILQLRLHPSIISLKEKIDKSPEDKLHEIDLTYITSRGNWYFISWKGDIEKSGGIATNIGIHFFDMLIWIFGGVKKNVIHLLEKNRASGYLELERAKIRWFLSLDYNDIPQSAKTAGNRTYRSIIIDKEEIEFSYGFDDLHTRSYVKILEGDGYGLREAKPAIETVYGIRNALPVGLKGDYHPLCKRTYK